jgi:hypothetical protein
MPTISLMVGSMFELECLVNDVVVCKEQELKHLLLVQE